MSAPDTTFPPFDATLRDGRTVTVRAAVPDDAQAMLDYMHESLPEVQQYIVTTPEDFDYTLAQERELMASQELDRGDLWMLACDTQRVVGSLQCSATRRTRLAHVAGVGMTLRQNYRGQGLGGVMMGALIEWTERHPVLELLQLSVYADNPRAITLYRKFGFVEAGRVPRRMKFGPGRYKDDVSMYRCVLKPPITEAGS